MIDAFGRKATAIPRHARHPVEEPMHAAGQFVPSQCIPSVLMDRRRSARDLQRVEMRVVNEIAEGEVVILIACRQIPEGLLGCVPHVNNIINAARTPHLGMRNACRVANVMCPRRSSHHRLGDLPFTQIADRFKCVEQSRHAGVLMTQRLIAHVVGMDSATTFLPVAPEWLRCNLRRSLGRHVVRRRT